MFGRKCSKCKIKRQYDELEEKYTRLQLEKNIREWEEKPREDMLAYLKAENDVLKEMLGNCGYDWKRGKGSAEGRESNQNPI